MRANTAAILADSRCSIGEFTTKARPTPHKWAHIRTQTPREMLALSAQHARSDNERAWGGSGTEWQGLGSQSVESLDASGIAEHARDALKNASATLSRAPNKPGKVQPAIVGGSWSVPAVLANLPLAARARVRNRLPPVNLKIVLAWSASVSDETVTPVFAKLSHAIWAYTLAGGAVDLRVYALGFLCRSSVGAKGLIAESRVPAADISQLALGLSAPYFRAITGPLCTALSDEESDSIMVPQESDNPIPGSIYIGGRTASGDIAKSLAGAFEALKIK